MSSTKYTGQGVDMGGALITNSGSPSGATDLATKGYVDNLEAGLEWKLNVACASTANLTLATGYVSGQVIDGYTLVTGDRVLLKNQTAQTDNGIRVVAVSGAPARATDADSTAELNNAVVGVVNGTANGGKTFQQTTKNPTIGTDNIVFTQFNVGIAYTGSTGIVLTGTNFTLDTAVAGNGLTYTGGVLSLTNSDGTVTVATHTASVALASGGHLTASGGAGVKVDATVSIIFNQATNANSTTVSVTHSLGVQFLSGVAVYITSTGEKIACDATATSSSVMTFSFNTAPALNTLTFALSI